MRKWPKLTAVYDIDSHVALAIHRCMGPRQDSPQLAPSVCEAAGRQRIVQILADKGYDAEHGTRCAESNHKRLLGSALRARTWLAQRAEMALRVITHNCMLVANT